MKAFSIEGFTSDTELKWLARLAKNSRLIADVGSWRGRSAIAMAESTQGFVYAVDHFMGSPGLEEFSRGKCHDWLYHEFLRNTRQFPNIEAVRMNSLEGAEHFRSRGTRFDLVFIDADHEYESVRDDIKAWLPLVSPGGVLTGDDLQYGPVKYAVKEAFMTPGEVVTNGKLWMVMR